MPQSDVAIRCCAFDGAGLECGCAGAVIKGTRWHNPEDDSNLCATAFEATPQDERGEFVRIELGSEPVPHSAL